MIQIGIVLFICAAICFLKTLKPVSWDETHYVEWGTGFLKVMGAIFLVTGVTLIVIASA